jgi:uncharacterized protein (DUF362 family)
MTARRITRRNFVIAGSLGGGALLASSMINRETRAREQISGPSNPENALVVARKNGTVADMVSSCVEALGGMESFVPTGSKVVVKVNGSWSNPGANTSPEVVSQVVKMVKSAGPSTITVYDHLIQSPGWSSIASAAMSAGAQALSLGDSQDDYVYKSVPGVKIHSARYAEILDQADVLINVPLLKTHNQGQVTIGLKNHLGSVQDRGKIHTGGDTGLQQGIADLNSAPIIRSKHRLTICDAIDPMVKGGPSRGTHEHYNGIIAGMDPVATDYIGTQIIRRFNPSLAQNPTHIRRATELGLGTDDPNHIEFDEVDLSQPVPEPSLALTAATGMAAMALLRRRP